MNEGLPYQKDEWLYALWKLLNSERLLDGRKKGRFEDLAAPDKGVSFSAMMLCQELRFRGLELNGLEFHTDLFKKYDPQGYQAALDFIKEKPEAGVSKSFKKVFAGKFTLQDVENACMLQKFGLVEWFEYDAKLPSVTHRALSEILNFYTDAFIDDELIIGTVNYLKFEEQKKNFLRELHGFYLHKFSKRFVYKTHVSLAFLGESDSDKEKLFIHTLVAMEKLDYLTIEAIWVYDRDLPPDKQQENYKVRMTVTPKLREEAQEAFDPEFIPKKEPGSDKKPATLVFDENRSILSFQGKEVEISKSKNKNPHYLLKTLFKEKERSWSYDEIAEDWEEEFSKKKWKRYWYAAYTVNGKVARKTGVENFLLASNKEVQINSKYL